MNALSWWWRLWKRRNEPPVQRNLETALDTAASLGGDAMLKKVVGGVQWFNLLTLVAQLLNDFTNAFPSLQTAQWVIVLQGLIGVILPSVGGIAHQVIFKAPQDPAAK
jgi:hypothetical protein